MKYLLILLCLLCLTFPSQGQAVANIREKIIPLHSTRYEVEKIAKPLKDYQIFYRYETKYGNIDVFYSKEECVGHGWNVKAETVIGYRYYPKNLLTIKDIPNEVKGWIKTSDDALFSYYTDVADGVQYVFDQNDQLSYITYSPSEKDAVLRCSGFPKYSPLSYQLNDKYTVKDISDWDVGLLSGFIIKVKENTKQKGYIFIYAEKGKENEVKNLQKKIEDMAYQKIKVGRQKVIIKFGGLRDKTIIEEFLIPNNYPAPVPEPLYGSNCH